MLSLNSCQAWVALAQEPIVQLVYCRDSSLAAITNASEILSDNIAP